MHMLPRLLALALMMVVAACAPTVQTRGNAVTTPILSEGVAIMDDGHRLPLRIWRAPPEIEERAVVIALHGMNDYSNAFAMPGPWFATRGVTVYAYDQRGFGQTAQPGIWAGTDLLTSDLRTMVPLVAAVHPGKPIFLLGESMGGAVVLATMGAPKAPAVTGVILSAPAVWGRATMNPLYRIALWLVPRIAPGERMTGQGLKIQASDNIPMLVALGRDPLVIKGTRADSIAGLADLMDEGLAAAPRLKVPSLVLYGEKDQVIPKAPVERMVETLGGPHRIAVYPNGWHLLLRDLDREVVWRDILVWMMDRQAPLPSDSEKQPGSHFASSKNKSNFN